MNNNQMMQQQILQQQQQQMLQQQQQNLMQQSMMQQNFMMQQKLMQQKLMQQKLFQQQQMIQQQMMQQKLMQQQMGQNQVDNNFNVIFRVSGRGENAPPITIQCQANEKVSTIINRYRNKSGDREQKKKFIFNAKVLNPTLTASESGLANNSTIHVINLKGLEGARI